MSSSRGAPRPLSRSLSPPGRKREKPPTDAELAADAARDEAAAAAVRGVLKAKLIKRMHDAKGTRTLDLGNVHDAARFSFGLTEVPSDVVVNFKASPLAHLWLTNNKLTGLPVTLRSLNRLVTLCVSGNALREIPTVVFELPLLERLLLADNRISSVPDGIAKLTHLTELRLDRNDLARFPTAVTAVRSLRRLGLTRNMIDAVPPEITRLTNIVELSLDHNKIGPTLPAEFWRLAGLRILGLSDNRLEAIPPFLLRTLKIVVLRIDGNRAPDYVVKHSSGMVLPGVVMPHRADGYMQTRVGGMVIGDDGLEKHQVVDLPGYVMESRMFNTRAARWFKEDGCRARSVLASRLKINAALKARAAAAASAAPLPSPLSATPRSTGESVKDAAGATGAAAAPRPTGKTKARKEPRAGRK